MGVLPRGVARHAFSQDRAFLDEAQRDADRLVKRPFLLFLKGLCREGLAHLAPDARE